MALAPQLTVSDRNHGLSFDMEPPMGFKSSNLEGLWWSVDDKTQGQVALSNTTSENLNVQLGVEWQGVVIPASPISLSAHQTLVLEIEKLLKDLNISARGIERGGLSITHNGAPGALIAQGVVLNKEHHFASNLNFVDPAGQRNSVLNGTGLMLAHPAGSLFPENSFFTPQLTLKNASVTSQTATVTVTYTANGRAESKALPTVRLSPHEVRAVDFTRIVAGLRNVLVSSAGIKIEGSGAAGTLIVALSSIDSSSNTIVDVPLVSRSERSGEGGNHPFRLDENFQSVAYLTNITQRPTRMLVAIFHQGGMFTPELMTVGPRETITIDLLQLRNSQAKDVQNRTLPLDLTEGQVFWKPHEAEALVGRVVTFDRAGGTASNFSCPNCCGYEPTRWVASPDPFSGPPGSSQQMTLYQYETLCGCCEMGPYVVSWVRNVYSDNTSVATVDVNAMVNFVNPGSANIVWAISYYHSDNISAEDCGNFTVDTEVPCPVQAVQVINVTAQGAIKVTSVNGDQNIIHFVTPKGAAGENVTLTATISPNDQASANQITWSGATQDPMDRLKATVRKDSASKTVVKVRVGGNTAKELRVWVVWATISSTDAFPVTYQQTPNLGTINGGYKFVHTIQPASIITDSNRPNLSGAKTIDPPGGNHWTGDPLKNGADKKWDNSRQMRTKWILSAGLTPTGCCGSVPPDGITYPTDDVEGNDDRSTGEETNDPYNNSGKLTGEDNPTISALHGAGNNGDTIELRLHFREFTRLEIEGSWYRISDYYLWRIHIKMIKSGGVWINNGSNKALDNNSF